MNNVHYISLMPKLIPELESRILKTAEEMFAREGFDAVSMRMLASRLNIAVGTLYNYFSNKTDLFYSIMTRSWENTFLKLETTVADSTSDLRNARKKAIRIIYEGIKNRSGFAAKTFGRENVKNRAGKLPHHRSFSQTELTEKLTKILNPLGAGFSGQQALRLVRTLIASIRFFVLITNSAEMDEDVDFLMQLIEYRK